MVHSQGTNTQAPSHPDLREQTSIPDHAEQYMSLLRESQAEREQVLKTMTPTNPSDLAPSANPYIELAAATPENAQVSDQTDAFLWPTGPDFDCFGPGSSTGDSPAIDLGHQSHFYIDTSSEPQQHTLQTQRDASSAHPPIHDLTHSPVPDTVVKDIVDAQALGSPTGGLSYVPHLYHLQGPFSQYHTPQTQGNTPYSSIIDLASPTRGVEVSESVVQSQTSQPSKGGSSGDVRDYNSFQVDGWLSSQQQHTYQRKQNVSSHYHADPIYAPARDGDVPHNLIETQREGSPTSQPAPDIRYPAVSSSSQLQRHEPQNQQDVSSSYPHTPDTVSNNPVPNAGVSRDVVYAQAQVPGSSAAYFRDYSYLGVGPSSQSQQRSNVSQVQRNKRKQSHRITVGPSKRVASPINDNVQAARPYPNSASRSSARNEWTHTAPSSRSPKRSSHQETKLSASSHHTNAAEEAVRYPVPHEPSLAPPPHIVLSQVQPHSVSVGPSKRVASPAVIDNVRAARPYANPASRSPARNERTPNIASSSRGPRRSSHQEKKFSASNHHTNAGEETVGYPVSHESSLALTPHIVQSQVQPSSVSVGLSKRVASPAMIDNIFQKSSELEARVAELERKLGVWIKATTRKKNLTSVELSTLSGPANANVRVPDQFCLRPASRSSARNERKHNILPSSTGPRCSNHDEVHISASSFPMLEEAVGYPSATTPLSHEPSSAPSPYTNPASRSSARYECTPNFTSSPTGPRRSNHDEVNLSASSLPMAGYPSATTPFPHELSSAPSTHIPEVRAKRVSVPLRPFKPDRRWESDGSIINFWTWDMATGNIIPGTYFADRLYNNPDCSLMDPESLPFGGKTQTAFALKILWPGYKDYKKAVTISKSKLPCSQYTLKMLRDQIYKHMTMFIKMAKELEDPSQLDLYLQWRVAVDDPAAIHVQDLILVRVRQVSQGCWVPEIDVLRKA